MARIRLLGSRSSSTSLWLLFHGVLIGLGLLSGPIHIDTSFFSIMPEAQSNAALANAEAANRARMNGRLQILVGAEDFQDAYAAAEGIVDGLSVIGGVSEVSWKTPESAYQELRDYISQNSHFLLSREDRELLQEPNGAEIIASQALAEVYGPMSMADLSSLESDPFLLGDRIIKGFLAGASELDSLLSPRDGVMAGEFEGHTYVLVNALLEEHYDHGAAVVAVETLAASIEASRENRDIIVSGFPVHNAQSSRNAQREITIISSISLSVLTLLLIITFRSAVPFLASLMMIAVAGASAFSFTLLIFGSVHLLALVFGTSLIGISLDYSLHFFVSRRGSGNGVESIREIFSGIGLGMVTTIISYLALIFTPIPLLQQIAVLSIAGLVSSFASVTLIFPYLEMGKPKTRIGISEGLEALLMRLRGLSGKGHVILLGILTLLAAALLSGLTRTNLNNDVRNFYAMSDGLAEREMRAASITGAASYSDYFMVLGKSPQEVLDKERRLLGELEGSLGLGAVQGRLCISDYIPPLVEQAESYNLVRSKLAPLVGRQYTNLGFPVVEEEAWKQRLQDAEETPVRLGEALELTYLSSLANLWIGEVEGGYASMVMLRESDRFTALSDYSGDGVYWIESVEDISRTLQAHSRSALWIIAGAYGVIFILLAILRGIGPSLKICAVPIAAVLGALGLISWVGAPFNIFAIFGFILTMGIGIDYTIFLYEGQSRSGSTLLAIILSCASTLLSFGALSMSSFSPVADFGRAVLWGVILSFILSPLILVKGARLLNRFRRNLDQA